jgi:hypothetical protein
MQRILHAPPTLHTPSNYTLGTEKLEALSFPKTKEVYTLFFRSLISYIKLREVQIPDFTDTHTISQNT